MSETSSDRQFLKPRRIRSFVLRTGRMTSAQQRALNELWPKYGVEYGEQQLDLNRLFGRDAPRMIEIGFGTGDALLAFAQSHPDMDCLGIEVHRPGAGHLLRHMQAQHLQNIRVSCHDAVEVLANQIPANSIDAVQIFFPDPWHKSRHHKRRLIQTTFADILVRVLKPGGILRLATDWQDYADHMRAVLDVHPDLQNVSVTTGFSVRPGDRPVTRFERRGRRLGHDIWELEYQRS